MIKIKTPDNQYCDRILPIVSNPRHFPEEMSTILNNFIQEYTYF
ncbi:hypothetical protein FDUTEX481_03283 [Tolypothrix sp. PCC 7601]|nr:hypothetical protein FDUTEX481_03283 [Tolypothrix sp. PCC 7601]